MGGIVSSIFGGGDSGSSSSGDSVTAANIAADSQREALDYLKSVDAIPQQYREQATQQLGNFDTSLSSTSQLMNQAKTSGMYDALLSGQEEAALRAQAATGGLRGGGSIADVGNVQNQALLQSYQNEANREQYQQQAEMSRLSGLAGLGSYAPQIANTISGIGETQAQGIIGQAQSNQASQQAGFGNLMGLGQLGLSAYSAFSDERLKEDIEHVGTENNVPIYRWKWNKVAEKLGITGDGYGTLSKVAKRINPDSVSMKDGFEQVNYKMIGVTHG